MAGDTVEQAFRLIGPRCESLGGASIAVRDEIAGEDLKIRRAPFDGSGQNHEIAVRAKLVRGIVHPPVGQ